MIKFKLVSMMKDDDAACLTYVATGSLKKVIRFFCCDFGASRGSLGDVGVYVRRMRHLTHHEEGSAMHMTARAENTQWEKSRVCESRSGAGGKGCRSCEHGRDDGDSRRQRH